MIISDDDVTLECSGRVLYANCGVIGLSPEGKAFDGWDSGLEPIPDKGNPTGPLSREERAELAAYMAARWHAFGKADPEPAEAD